MASDTDLAWFCGLFEGEGSFWFIKGVPKGLQISMTDLDILERVLSLYGGSLSPATRIEGKEHWKDAWRWSLSIRPSLPLVQQMVPYLGKRRTERAEEFIAKSTDILEVIAAKAARVETTRKQIKQTRLLHGYTHEKIAKDFGVTRSYVSHILAGKYDS